MALDAMDKGKDVYLEKPMVHTNDEARQLVATVKETKRVLQVGSQTTSADIWWKAKKAIADGMIGKMLMSQGSYHRNSFGGEWNEFARRAVYAVCAIAFIISAAGLLGGLFAVGAAVV